MLLSLGRRVSFGAMGFFAFLGFVSVPLGDKTGWGHLQAILASPATIHAIDEFKQSANEAQLRLIGWLTKREASSGDPEPSPAASAGRQTSDDSAPHKTKRLLPMGAIPIPKPPRLSE